MYIKLRHNIINKFNKPENNLPETKMDRVQSFSTKPEDVEAAANVKKLREYCDKNHINFSSMVLKGIKHVVEELKL